MASSRKNRQGDPLTDEARATTGALESGVVIQAVTLRRLDYREVGDPIRVEPGVRFKVDVKIDARINLSAEGVAELLMNLHCVPDAAAKPVEVVAQVGAIFRRGPDLTDEQLFHFVNHSGPRLAFPYLREIVSTVTGRGIYGPVYIDPLMLPPIMSEEAAKAFIEQLRTSNRG